MQLRNIRMLKALECSHYWLNDGWSFEIQVPVGGVFTAVQFGHLRLQSWIHGSPRSRWIKLHVFFGMFRSNQFVRWWSIFTTSRWWKRSWFQSTSQWRHWTKWRWAGPLVGNVFMGRWVKERFKSWCFSSCSFVFAPGRDFPFFFSRLSVSEFTDWPWITSTVQIYTFANVSNLRHVYLYIYTQSQLQMTWIQIP